MNNSWVKLYRKINDNEIIGDTNALQVFVWVLTNVDRTTGKVKVGRFWLSNILNLNPSTFYKALKRLEKKYKVVTLTSNNKFTTISLIHWAKYQSCSDEVTQSGNNKVTTREQQSNTLQEVENRELEKEHIVDAKISNRLSLTKGQIIAYLKEYPTLSTEELNEQRIKCNAHMNMSSDNYKNPGLFFKGWLNNYLIEKKELKRKEYKPIEIPDMKLSEEQRMKNMERIAEIRRKLVSKL